jgi:glycosyltransferase involved in cell wall biosynthesis
MKLGIDASNLSVRGGGATHLRGVLSAAAPQAHGIDEIVLFASRALLDSMPDDPWMTKCHHPWLDRGLLWRTWWQTAKLTPALDDYNIDLLMAPCGNYLGSFRPFVAMSHNLLLFEPRERQRFGLSLMRLKLAILGVVQRKCFSNADGMIMISDYAKMCIRRTLQRNLHAMPVIYHGVGDRFRNSPKPQRSIQEYSPAAPFKLLYVSTVTAYKHHDNLVRAFARLVDEGVPIRLELVGGAYSPSLRKLRKLIAATPQVQDRVTYHGSVPIDEVQRFYREADGFVFASSCENMPNILVEAMHAGLPICCSQRGPMPEILGQCGSYFSPDSVDSIAEALRQMLTSQEERARSAAAASEAATAFTWQQCSNETLGYLRQVYEQHRGSIQPAAAHMRGKAA